MVSQQGGSFEVEAVGAGEHFLLQLVKKTRNFALRFLRDIFELVVLFYERLLHWARHRFRRDIVRLVEFRLRGAAGAARFNRRLQRARHIVGVKDYTSVDVAGGAPRRLNQACCAAQESLLVGVEYAHKRHLGHVQALAQKVHAHERVGLAVESLRKTVEYAKTKGVALTIEDFGSRNSLTSYISQIEWLLEKVDGLKFTFDTGNFHLNGQNTDEALSKFKSKTVHVHCKDYLNSPAVGDAGFSTEKISVAVGKGDCQIGSIIKTFLADNYNGYFVVEYLGQKDAYEILLSSIKIFKE